MNGVGHLIESPLLSLPSHIWDEVFHQLDRGTDRIALCLSSRNFFAQWSPKLLKTLQGRNLNLPAGRFLRRIDVPQHASCLEFQMPSGVAGGDLSLLAKFLWLASPCSRSEPLSTTVHRCDGDKHITILMNCPSEFKAAPQLCAGHLPASPKKGERRRICIFISTEENFMFWPTDVRLRLSGSAAQGTADACFELRAAQPVFDDKRAPAFDPT